MSSFYVFFYAVFSLRIVRNYDLIRLLFILLVTKLKRLAVFPRKSYSLPDLNYLTWDCMHNNYHPPEYSSYYYTIYHLPFLSVHDRNTSD